MRFLRRKVDLRHLKWWWQRRTRGWDDRDLWSLDYTLAKWILPRLIEFQKVSIGIPIMNDIDFNLDGTVKDYKVSEQKWYTAQGKMIKAFQHMVKDGEGKILSPEDYREIDEGLDAFRRYLTNLWW